MIEFFFEYGLFALKALTLIVLIGALIALLIAMATRSGDDSPRRLKVVRLNERLKEENQALIESAMDEATLEAAEKARRSEEKASRKAKKKELKATRKKGALAAPVTAEEGHRVFVLDFDGDLQASAVDHLRREITAILGVATEKDEVVVRLESGGGVVHSYGLAASQLKRVRDRKVKLTICVDKVAASGGYMMACVADHLVAAPFAVIGSIGVVAQMPNFHRLLKKHDVDFELLTAGKHKRTLTVFGENTAEGREKFRDDLDDIHGLFKEFVEEERPVLDVDEVATGEIWLGRRALEKKLVDELKTSDEYLVAACEGAEVLEVSYTEKKSLQDRLMSSVEASFDRILTRAWHRATRGPLG